MNKLLRSAFTGVSLSALVLAAFGLNVSAQPTQPTVVPNITIGAPGLGVAISHMPDKAAFKLAPDGKTWQLATPGVSLVPGAPWLTVKELRFDPDPLVYNSILIQNNTGVPQIYTVGVSLPTTWPAPNLLRGSIDTSIIGVDGLISTVQNFPIYSAQIDFNTVKTLQNAPWSLSTPKDAVSSPAQFGLDPSAIAVASSIGIQLRFQLSPGDTAAIISDFEVLAVPEPATLGLLLLGGLLVWRRHNK